MSTTADLLTGIGTLLNTAGVGTWSTGAAVTTGTVITAEFMPPTPDRAIVLTTFPMEEDPVDTTARWVLQVHTRGLPNQPLDALNLRDAVKDAVNGLRNLTWGSTGLTQCIFYTSFPVGVDDTVRYEHIQKFWLDLDQAPTSLRPAGGWD